MAIATPRNALLVARETVEPVLREHGYSAGRRSGPGVEWERQAETGRFSFHIASSPWDEISGGKVQVDFGGDVLDLFYSAFLHYLPESAQGEWQVLVESIYERALRRGDAADGVDDDLVETRRLLLQQELDGLAAGCMDAFGWPWFDGQGLLSLYRFIAQHFARAEKAALADAHARLDEES